MGTDNSFFIILNCYLISQDIRKKNGMGLIFKRPFNYLVK